MPAAARGRARPVAHALAAADDELDVDVLAMRFPRALVHRPGRVFLHERDEPVAIDLVAADRHRGHVVRTQILERLTHSRRNVRVNRAVPQPIDDHSANPSLRSAGDRSSAVGATARRGVQLCAAAGRRRSGARGSIRAGCCRASSAGSCRAWSAAARASAISLRARLPRPDHFVDEAARGGDVGIRELLAELGDALRALCGAGRRRLSISRL